MDRMQQQWNLQNFKYQLLIDMWAMRVRFLISLAASVFIYNNNVAAGRLLVIPAT